MPNHQVLFTASDGWGYFFLTSSPILDLGHFLQVILPIVLLIMPQLSGAVHSIWWLGFFFFLTCSQILDLGHFLQVILPIVLQIMPPAKNNPNHQVLWTASDGWGYFFFDLFSHSGLRAFFTNDFANCTTDICPTIRCCSQHLMVGVIFFLTSSHILDLVHFSQMILPIVLQAICPTIRCCSQHLMVGVNFLLTSSPILDLGHFSQVILPIVLQIMPQPKNNPNHQVLWTASDGWGYFIFWPLLTFWT